MIAGAFRFIVCTHDLSPDPVAIGEERLVWVPFPAFLGMFGDIEAATRKNGVALELTSDDGFASDYELLFPWLLETGRTATFFIPTAFVGRPGRVTVAQLREMQAHGMRIGSHGTNHINWTRVSDAEMRGDIVTGIASLQDMLGEKTAVAAPPYGAYNRDVIKVLRDAGIDEVHSCRGGYAIASGALRTRVALASDAAVNAGIVELARRAPGPKDLLRGAWHRVQGALSA